MMRKLVKEFKLSGSVIAFIAISSLVPGIAVAQGNGGDSEASGVESITVTGTNIRGGTAVGSNVITFDQQNMESTGQIALGDILHSMPALTNFGTVSQGGQNSPNIHQLGQSASTSTLTVLDGMRIPVGGVIHSLPNPSIIPANAVERVDVLADGSSSIYGSDAVAGVVNIITRESYDGLEVDVLAGGGKSENRLGASVLWGTNWANGNVMLAYQHSYASGITNASRFPNVNYTANGYGNFGTFNCSPATVQPGGHGNVYLSPTSTTSIANTQANAPCYTPQGYYQPKDIRDNALVKFTQNFGQKFSLKATMMYAINNAVSYGAQRSSQGTLTATAYGTGPQANPFYVNPPGVTATSQTVRFDFNGLLPQSLNSDGANDIYAHVEGDYVINDNWSATLTAVAGQDYSFSYVYGGLCSACASLALNGTAQASGSTSALDILGTTIINTQLPLTTANALDVWDPVGSNKTSAATIANLASGTTGRTATNAYEQYRINVNGSLFDLPAGALKVAVGGEIYNNSLVQTSAQTNSTGPASYGSGFSAFHFGRKVKAVFGEANIPVISPEMNIPFVQKVDVDISLRYDDYSDVGPTTNPKYAATWTVIDGLKFRGTYSTSFVAPQLDSIGDPSQNYRASYGGAGGDQVLLTFPTALYPGTAGVLPGCAAGAVTCQIGTSSTPGFKEQRGIGPTAKPQRGDGYTLGVDFAPGFLPGLVGSLTLWNSNFKGAVTSENGSVYANVASLGQYFQIFPSGISSTSAFVQDKIAPFPTLNRAIQPTVYYFYGDDQLNVFNLYSTGLDYDVRYYLDTGYGQFRAGIAGTEFLMQKQSFGYPVSGPIFSVMNSNGFNSLFPDIQMAARLNAGWSKDGFAVDLYLNYTGGYRNWNNPIKPITHDANGNPNGGGDPVSANKTLDMHVSYTMPDGILTGDELYVSGTNIFNSSPPFFNTANGYDSAVANKMGRIIELGLKAKF
jgi:iron complex outermembrane receptor protein